MEVGPYLKVKHGKKSGAPLTPHSELRASLQLFFFFLSQLTPLFPPWSSETFLHFSESYGKGQWNEIRSTTDVVSVLQPICTENPDNQIKQLDATSTPPRKLVCSFQLEGLQAYPVLLSDHVSTHSTPMGLKRFTERMFDYHTLILSEELPRNFCGNFSQVDVLR